mgnify:CR=1 FL=1
MVSKIVRGKDKFIVIALIMTSIIGALVGKIYSTNNNHYVVDVTNAAGESKDNNLQVTEKIVKGAGAQYFDSKELNYEVELKNIGQAENVETQVAIVTDFSYSMETNDTNNVVRGKAIDLANGIITNVKNSRVSISNNNALKLSMTTNTSAISSTINSLNYGEGNDSNQGLDNANSSFTTPAVAGNTVNKYIVVFTDATDDVSEKMKQLTTDDPNLHIISILVDMTSTSYVVNDLAVCGEVYLLLSGVSADDINSNIEMLDLQKIYDNMNKSTNNIEVTNEFSDEVQKYFSISDLTVDNGNVTQTAKGYIWNIDRIRYQDTAKLKFKLTLKTNVDIDAGIIFKDIFTNKEQNISYTAEGKTLTLNGTDARGGTSATTLKICQGYDLKIKAVNESNTGLPVDGIDVKVVGIKTNDDGSEEEEVCNITKKTDSNGYITITPDDARALRLDGEITFTVTPTVEKVGYSYTNPVTFTYNNNVTTKNIEWVETGSGLNHEEKETERVAEVVVPINSQKSDLELRVEELNNSNALVPGSTFELIQPKLNNKYEMDVLSATTDDKGAIHFAPTVMTKDGTYNYILRQVSAPDGYELTPLTLITIEYKNGKIVRKPATQFNENIVSTELCTDVENHTLIVVGLKNLKQDPFDLEINLSDRADGTKLDGVTYLIETIGRDGVSSPVYATTDSNGQVKIKCYGDGALKIKITEQSPKVGYVADTKTKVLDISRNNKKIEVWVNEDKLDIDQDANKENLIIKLNSQKKAERNVVKINLVDSNETDVPVGAGVTYELVNTETGVSYGKVVSNRNGELSFTIDNNTIGDHTYKLVVDKNSLPAEYENATNSQDVDFNIHFDKDGYIDGINATNGDQITIDEHSSSVNSDDSVEYTAFLKLAYELNIDNTADFKIQLLDHEDLMTPIDGASYNVDIEWTVNGITRTKTIKGRKTNASGQITTKIIKGNSVKLTVTQVGAKTGYGIDNTTQEIELTYNTSGALVGISQSPYDKGDTNTDEPNQGAYKDPANTNNVIYQHLNRKRTTEDTYLNLTITKQDMNNAYKDGVILNIKSSSLLDKEGNGLDLIVRTGQQGDSGVYTFDYGSYLQNKIDNDTIRVPGIGEEGNEIVYDLEITEMNVDSTSDTGYSPKKGTTFKARLIFKYRDGSVKLTSVEPYYGNRLLVHDPIYSSSSDTEQGQQDEDSMGVYLANITLNLRTDYDDVGNLSLDLKKEDINEEPLIGAKYNLKVTNPDGTVIRKNDILVENGSSNIEISGLNVNVGSTIELNEVEAPIGYGINKSTEVLEVTAIGDDGEITLERKDATTDRLKLVKMAATTTTAGTLKTNYEISFVDYQLDTFGFGITAIDSNSNKGVDRYSFNVDSSKGATGTLTTDSDGNGSTRVGGSIESNTIEYTISTNHVADYYKPLNSNIKVNVVFNAAGAIDIAATQNAQTDPNYNTLWKIKNLVQSNDEFNFGKIDIEILVDHQEPLNVKVETIDKITNTKVSDVQYKITPSEELPATGSDSINVGYVLENGMLTYTLSQTNIKNSYAKLEEKDFKVTYSNENITNAELTKDNVKDDTITVTGNKQVTIKVYVEPKVPFEITNLYYFNNNTKLQGSNFEVTEVKTEDVGTGTTDANGISGIYSGILGADEDVTYKVRQTLGASGYATVDDFYIKVHYNADREITSAKLVDSNGEDVSTNKFVTIGFTKTSTFSTYNSNNKGIVTIQVLNYPEFKINIDNVDRRDGTTKIVGTEYSVASQYTTSDNKQVDFMSTKGVITNSNGLGVAHLDKTKENTVVTYTVKEDIPAIGYQSLGTEIKVKVTFDGDGYVSNVEVENDSNLNKIESVSRIQPITDPADNFVVNLQLKNNPILKFNLTAEDSADHSVKIKDLGFTIVSTFEDTVYSNSSATNKVNQTENPETSYTDINGYTASYLDRTLDNKDMYYTIKEVQKAPGYDWAGKDIIIKVTYDSDGKIDSITPVQGGELINISSFDKDNFEINMEIYNDEIKSFGINLSAVDTYDTNKKISNMKVNAFLTEEGNTNYTKPDDDYKLMDENSLLTGADRNNDGKPDIAQGEDYKTMGQYNKGAGTRTLRLVVLNDTSKDDEKAAYYLDSADDTNSGNNVGYYKGAKYYKDAKYQNVRYQYLINVTFDDEGKITDAKLQTGLNPYVGWLVDNRYIQTQEDGVSLDHTDYRLNITMKFFPMLDLKLNAMDNYTYQNEISKDGQPIALEGSKYTVTTLRHNESAREEDELVTAGYIGYGTSYGYYGALAQADYYEATDELFVPIENNHTRLFYVFEEMEPTNYQKYTDRYLTRYSQKLVAIIQVTFDEYGEINYDKSIVRNVNDTEIKPYIAEDGTTYLSSNNIQEYNYYYDKTEANRNINFYIGYGLTTKINVTAVDDISSSPISNIRMTPFINDTYGTNTSYEFNTVGYRDTNSSGQFDIKYWGAATQDNVNKYIIGSSRYGDNYNGYMFPSDMASTSLNGSGNEKDYYANLDISYDSNGKISNVKSVGKDLWGDDNVSNITWDSKTGNIYINMLYSRKFQMTLNKTDYYDSTINKLVAKFDVISDKGLKTSINSKQTSDVSRELTPIGKVYANKTIKYTLSETQVPEGYYPLQDTIDYYVTFDKNGNVGTNSVKSTSDYFEIVSTSDNTEKVNKTSPDLTINVKNKPAFNFGLRVIDQFYKNDGISDVYLKITNSKGDVALGNPQTDENGYVTVVTGPVYPKETVKYYISQTNTADGYYQNSATIELEVKFNDIGKVEAYKILNGNEVINNFNSTAYMNTRQINMQIMNMPKDLKIGLYKYDKTTNSPMAGVKFTITKEDVNSGVKSSKQITTENDGNVVQAIDTFETSISGKTIKYTIHEDETPASYRTMEDIVFIIRYNADGSIASSNQVQNDNGVLSEIKPEIAIGTIKKLDDKRVHFAINAPNDNAYDLIIKNEDTNYSGFGIKDSEFDVSINGTKYTPELTNEEGETSLKDLTQSGDITIKIAQKEVGDGYKSDIDNKVEINLVKGEDVYSIDLKPTTNGYVDDKNATTTKAVIVVDETYGTITVTFKNETKTEITLFKQDINTNAALKNTEFKVTAQQVDDSGSNIGSGITLTTNDNKITDSNGQIHFDLGVAPQSQIWKYTFEEITPPEGYNPIADLVMTVKYDQYGRISEQKSNKESRLKPTTEHPENENCRNMYAIIKNGDVSPAYTVKVVTEDVDTGKRISGSEIFMNITKEDGSLIEVEPKTSASATNGSTSITGNLGIDGTMYTDEEVENPKVDTPAIVEKGLTYIDNIDYEGTINIDISQQKAATGYIFGNQKTSTDEGQDIKINTKYVPHLDEDPTVEFTIIDNDGFEVRTDDVNRIITIVIKNESQVSFDIVTELFQSDLEEEKHYISGVNYNITSEILTATNSIPTDLNATTPLSDEKGETKENVGKAYAGKTVLYTLHQNIPLGYRTIDDIQIEVQYDSRGYIKYYEMLSSEDNAYINEENTTKRTIALVVRNKKDIENYVIYVEKHAKDTDEDEDAYQRKLPNAKYQITVNQQYGAPKTVSWVDVTDENGEIRSAPFNGYGYISAQIKELEAPEGYELDEGVKYVSLYRNQDTGEFKEDVANEAFTGVDNNIEYDSAGNRIIRILPKNEQQKDKFTMVINKISKETGKYITDNQANFKVELKQTNDEGEITYYDTLIENAYTDKNGKLVMDNLQMPGEAGEYKLVITELNAPEGYLKLSEPVEIPVTFGTDSAGNIIIISANTIGNGLENISASKVDKQILGINVGNEVDNGLKDDEYSLDITKVDAKTGEAIENMAIFKVQLPDENNTSVYTETKETLLGPGKLDYCYIEQDKDYTVRLTHMKKPTEPGIYVYKFKEIVAPEGYAKIDDEFELSIEFAIDEETGKMYIKDVNSSNEDYLRINTEAPYDIEKPISIDILNNEDKGEQYTIHYDANDNGEGITAPADQIKDKDVDLQLSAEELSRTGYIFKGWATLPNATTPDFKAGDTYTLNQSITLYAVWEENLYLKSTEYVISDDTKYVTDAQLNENKYENGDTYILGINPKLTIEDEANANEWTKGTKLEDFINNIQTNADNVKLYDTENKEITTEDKYIGTGMTVEFIKGNQTPIRLTIIARGDLNGDGILNLNDITKAKRYIKKDETSILDTVIKKLAFDTNLDGKLNMRDSNNMQRAQSNDDIRKLDN